jgi:large subunit ribosomal protein L15
MKLNELSPAERLDEAAHARRPRRRLGQGQDGRPRRQRSEGPLGRVPSMASKAARCRSTMRLPKRGFTPRGPQDDVPGCQPGPRQQGGRSRQAGRFQCRSEETALVASWRRAQRSKTAFALLAKACEPRKPSSIITVTGASKAAIAAVEKAGGKVTVTGAGERHGCRINSGLASRNRFTNTVTPPFLAAQAFSGRSRVDGVNAAEQLASHM